MLLLLLLLLLLLALLRVRQLLPAPGAPSRDYGGVMERPGQARPD